MAEAINFSYTVDEADQDTEVTVMALLVKGGDSVALNMKVDKLDMWSVVVRIKEAHLS